MELKEASARYFLPADQQIPKGYKQTEVGVIPEDWTMKPLGDIATLQRGYDLPGRLRKLGPFPIVTSSGTEDWHREARVKGPGVVTGRYGTIGEVFWVVGDFWPLNTTLYVRDFHGNDPFFISYLLRTIDFQTHSGKSGVPGVNRNDLHEILVPLPSTKVEQEAIAEALSDADALIESLEQLIAKKRQLKQGAMQELLTGKRRLPGFDSYIDYKQTSIGIIPKDWKDEALGNSTFLQGGYSFQSKAFCDIGIPVIRISNVQNGSVDIDAAVCHPKIAIPYEFIIKEGDTLMAMSGATTGKVGVYRHRQYSYQNQRVGKFVTKVHLQTSSLFIAHLVRSDIFLNRLNVFLEQGAQPNISSRQVESLVFALPPTKAEQTAIAQILSDMDAEIAELETKLAKARSLKQGMMQQLLTGKIRLV